MGIKWSSHVICFGGILDGQEIPLLGIRTDVLGANAIYEYIRISKSRIIAVYAGKIK